MEELRVGKTFQSAAEMETFFSKYEKETGYKVSKVHTHSFIGNDILKYHSLSMQCIRFGLPRKSEKPTKRFKISQKCECPFIIKMLLTKTKNSLQITKKSVFSHNEKCKSFVEKKIRENEAKTTINDNNGIPKNLNESLKMLFSNDIPSKEIDGKKLCEINSSSEVKQQGKNC